MAVQAPAPAADTQGVEPARCPSCNAIVANRAAWCTLCFADLRPPEQRTSPPAQPAAVGQAVAEAAPPPAALVAAPAVPAASATAAGATAAGATAASAAAAAQTAGWPCLRCGTVVALELDACPTCGAGFLAGSDHAEALRVPVVGDLAHANAGVRFVVGLVAAAVLCGGFLLVLLILGKLL